MGNSASVVLEIPRLSESLKNGSMVQEILTPQDRPVRLPLDEWAHSRLGELERLKGSMFYDKPEVCGAIVDCFNEAALIEVYYGRLDYAKYLCNAAMKWVNDLAQSTGSAWCYRFAVQPYVNLGRLDRIARRWEQSLEKIKVAGEVADGHPVGFGPIILDRTSLRQMAEHFPDPTVLRNIFILDTLKTLLKAGWYSQVRNYFSNWEAVFNLEQKYFVCEASLVALGQLQDYGQALELCAAYLRNSQGGNRLVFLYRRAEILVAAGRVDEAMRILGNLVIAFEAYPGGLTLNQLIVLAALCRLLVRLGFDEIEALLRSGAAAALRLREVVLERDFLQMLAQISHRQDLKDEVQNSLQRLHEINLYNTAHQANAAPAEIIHQLSGQLLDFAGYRQASSLLL